MRCDEFETRLNDLLDRRVLPETDAGLCAHARKCATCGGLLEAQELLFEGLSALKPTEASDMSAAVLAAVRQSSRPIKSVRWDGARTWFPWVAAAGIMIGMGALLSRLPNRIENNQLAVTPNPELVVPRAENRHPIHPEYVKIVQDTGETVALALRWPGVPLDDANVVGPDEDTPEWVEEVTNGIRPLTRSMGAALDAVRSSIPGGLARSG